VDGFIVAWVLGLRELPVYVLRGALIFSIKSSITYKKRLFGQHFFYCMATITSYVCMLVFLLRAYLLLFFCRLGSNPWWL
jgi:hypothetical protein